MENVMEVNLKHMTLVLWAVANRLRKESHGALSAATKLPFR